MKALRLFPVILSFIVLGAHFLRLNQMEIGLFALIFPLFLMVKTKWTPRVFQVALLLATAEWLRSGILYVQMRQESGDDWVRLAIIMGGVALFTLLSALVFLNKKIKKHYS